MIDIICALCGKNQQTEVLFPSTFNEKNISSDIYSARRLPDKIHYQILKCKNCGLVFSSPIFKPEQIEKLYRESLCNYYDQIPYLTNTYLGLFETISKDLPNNPKVLEIGCGNGFFLEALKKRGINQVYGVEPSKKIVSEALKDLQKEIKVDIFKKNQFLKNSFDLVCCFHTLDHIVNVNEFISEIFSVLKKGGIALIVVHDTEGLSVKIFGEKSPIFDIEHIYLFNKKNLADLFRKHNFQTLKPLDLKNTYPLIYWLKMAHLPSKIKNLLINFFNLFKISKIELKIKAGNIAIAAVKKKYK